MKHFKPFEYFINCAERGEFRADVRNPEGETVFEFGHEIFEDGYMKNRNDIIGLLLYLRELGVMSEIDFLVWGN